MEFTLTYRGPLRANAKPADKHAIRRHFHPQLKRLWEQLPLNGYRRFLEEPTPEFDVSIIETAHGFRFAPLVSAKIHFVASLDVLLLRPEEPGHLLAHAGDLDNRIKTLLDALKVPHESTALPALAKPADDENPFFCLLQDDALIVNLAIRTDRWLEPDLDRAEVLALLHVRTTTIKSLIGTMGL